MKAYRITTQLIVCLCALLVMMLSCNKEPSLAEIESGDIYNITRTTAQLECRIITNGGASITYKGICWGTTNPPTLDNEYTRDGFGSNSFIGNLSGLTANTSYYVRPYAINAAGTIYGACISFKTTTPFETITDADGNVYNAVQIGSQIWLDENLKTTKYQNGESITKLLHSDVWEDNIIGVYSYLESGSNPQDEYGLVYNYYAISDIRGICPNGYHVADSTEWKELFDYCGGANIAGEKLKENGFRHWPRNANAGTNNTGFCALPGGSLIKGVGCYGVSSYSKWWISSIPLNDSLQSLTLRNNSNSVTTQLSDTHDGNYVRCIKD